MARSSIGGRHFFVSNVPTDSASGTTFRVSEPPFIQPRRMQDTSSRYLGTKRRSIFRTFDITCVKLLSTCIPTLVPGGTACVEKILTKHPVNARPEPPSPCARDCFNAFLMFPSATPRTVLDEAPCHNANHHKQKPVTEASPRSRSCPCVQLPPPSCNAQ